MEKHKHCLNCGISIPPDETFCSPKCMEEYMRKRKKAIRTQWILTLIMFGIIIFYLVYMFMKG